MKRQAKAYGYPILACNRASSTVSCAMQNFTANRNAYPLPGEDIIAHQGEFVAFSMDGINVLAFGKTIEDMRQALQERYQMTVKDVVLDTVH